MIVNNEFANLFSYPVRYVGAKVELYEGSTLADTYNQYYALKNLTIERVAEEGKFFGFGICQKINVHLVDKDRYIHITTADSMKPYFSVGALDPISNFPTFNVSEVHRDENTNELSVTAYDALYKATRHTVAEIGLGNEQPEGEIISYTYYEILEAICTKLGISGIIIPRGFETMFAHDRHINGGNFEGSELFRDALNAIAEATQTIYYLNSLNQLVFKELDKDGEPVFTIDREKYITLESGDNRRLATIVHATELGDNVSASTTETGSTQYIRDNPFWNLSDSVDTFLTTALAIVGGLTINQFECEWRGNYLLEIGDRISLETKDGGLMYSFLLDDVISYDGTLSQITRWQYNDNTGESLDNPTNLGEALRQTFAKVDKAHKEIELLVSETSANKQNITSMQMNTDSILANISRVEEKTNQTLSNINTDIETITNKVNASLTADEVILTIQEELANGVDKVYTSTGYSFDENGLLVSKSGSEMETLLDEDGLTVYRDNTEVLTADNTGVNGINMTVRQYLIVGGSRFEAYGAGRTGCFWVD